MDRGLRVEKGQKESRHLGSGQTGAEVLQVSVCDHGMGETAQKGGEYIIANC